MITEHHLSEMHNNEGFLVTHTLEQALMVADIIAKSSFCPKDFRDKPGEILVCMQMGKEVGLKPMQALQNIAVINGRPSIWGDAMVAICRGAHDFEYINETIDEASMMATCEVKRKNQPAVVRTFSKEDAKNAGLWGKQGTWTSYPKRMLQMRARGFACRDAFQDALRGMIIREEAEDMPPEKVDYSSIKQADAEVVISEDQLEQLNAKMIQAGSEEAKICAYAKVEKLDQLTLTQYSNIMRMLDKKIADKAQADMLKDLAKNKSKPKIDDEVTEFFDELGEVNTETGEVIK